MRIDRTEFGSITINGETYEFDVVIRLSGEIVKRKKKLSKKYYGTSHTISKEEAEFVYEDGCKELVVGTGHDDNVRLSKEAAEYFDKKAARCARSRRLMPSGRSTNRRKIRSASFM